MLREPIASGQSRFVVGDGRSPWVSGHTVCAAGCDPGLTLCWGKRRGPASTLGSRRFASCGSQPRRMPLAMLVGTGDPAHDRL